MLLNMSTIITQVTSEDLHRIKGNFSRKYGLLRSSRDPLGSPDRDRMLGSDISVGLTGHPGRRIPANQRRQTTHSSRIRIRVVVFNVTCAQPGAHQTTSHRSRTVSSGRRLQILRRYPPRLDFPSFPICLDPIVSRYRLVDSAASRWHFFDPTQLRRRRKDLALSRPIPCVALPRQTCLRIHGPGNMLSMENERQARDDGICPYVLTSIKLRDWLEHLWPSSVSPDSGGEQQVASS